MSSRVTAAPMVPSLGGRIAIAVGLAGIGVTQPLLDTMGSHPAFFVAGRYTSTQIIWFGVVVTVVPAVVCALVLGTAALLHRRVGEIVYLVVRVVLGAIVGAAIARALGLDEDWTALVAAAIGAAAVVLITRARAGRLLLEYLAVLTPLYLVGFLLLSPTSQLVSRSGGRVDDIAIVRPPGPVVVVVLDELPLSTLLHADGTINELRYPNFARLAAGSTWFRNASSSHNRTELAVPQVLTGLLGTSHDLPSYLDKPHNLFTMLGGTLPVERYEAITDMCPPTMCTTRGGQALSHAFEDAAIVYGHRVLPPRLRTGLPAIDQAWGNFGGQDPVAAPAPSVNSEFAETRLDRWFNKGDVERSPLGQAAVLERVAENLDGDPSLHFAHVILPHTPWFATPWRTTAMGNDAPPNPKDPADPAFEWIFRLGYQRHALQVGAVDTALGVLLDRLEQTEAWEDATVVVVADHGTSILPPDYGRTATENNMDEVYRVPLFVKAPGQVTGRVVDDPALTIDVMPTLADLLDVDLDWDFDGHSLFDGSRSSVEPLVGTDVEPLFDVVRRHIAQLPHGEDWTGLAAVGEHGALVGSSLDDHPVGPPSQLRWQADHDEEFRQLPTADGRAPQMLTGWVEAPDQARPPEVVVVVNGTIAGTIGGYVRQNGHWRFGTVLGPYLVAGANEIDAYEVVGATLRPIG